MPSGSDYEDMENRVKDDPEVFSRLYELNYRRILNYVLYSIGDIEIALDLTAETFLKAFKFRGTYDSRRASFTSWLYGIASKEIAMHFRKQSRESALVMSYFTFPEDIENARRSVNQEEIDDVRMRLEIRDEFMDLSLALRSLPVKKREILALRLLEDLPFEEIATLLRKRVGAVKNEYYRALRKLRKILQENPNPQVVINQALELPDDE
jgi:RNA polymerase sigma-70 factor (ECF subfamily)